MKHFKFLEVKASFIVNSTAHAHTLAHISDTHKYTQVCLHTYNICMLKKICVLHCSFCFKFPELSGGSCSGIKFKPFSDKELLTKNGSSETTNVTFQCITFMNEFEDKSFEELRYEDYLLNLKLPILYEGIDIKKDPYHKEVKSFLHDRKKGFQFFLYCSINK